MSGNVGPMQSEPIKGKILKNIPGYGTEVNVDFKEA